MEAGSFNTGKAFPTTTWTESRQMKSSDRRKNFGFSGYICKNEGG